MFLCAYTLPDGLALETLQTSFSRLRGKRKIILFPNFALRVFRHKLWQPKWFISQAGAEEKYQSVQQLT
jgi:hypothetical protein